jgi:hypothetical protein
VSDDLRKIYEAAGRVAYFFEETVPRDLYRGQSRTDEKAGTPLLAPNPGFKRRDGSVRLPDVKIEDVNGTPTVRGCRAVRGDFRGVSVFDKPTAMRGFRWFRLPQGVKIPAALAITQDGDLSSDSTHFTIAPKDDMPAALFAVWLKALADNMAETD